MARNPGVKVFETVTSLKATEQLNPVDLAQQTLEECLLTSTLCRARKGLANGSGPSGRARCAIDSYRTAK